MVNFVEEQINGNFKFYYPFLFSKWKKIMFCSIDLIQLKTKKN